jgi:hypothetical protein
MKLDPEERIISAALDQAALNQANERGAGARIEFSRDGHAGLPDNRVGLTARGVDYGSPSIIPRSAPRTRETDSPPALSRSQALVRETREPRVRIRLPPAASPVRT